MIKKYGKTSFIFFEIWPYLKPIRKFQIIFLFLFTLVSAFLEVISIGAVIPFMPLNFFGSYSIEMSLDSGDL